MNYLTAQAKKSGVKLNLGTEATAATTEKAKPDVVILATGGKHIFPDIPHLDQAHLVCAEDVLTGKVEVGMEVVVLGGELVGCETAEYLVERGRKVTIVEVCDKLATKITPYLSEKLLDRLSRKGVDIFTGVKREDFLNSSLTITTRENQEKVIQVNTIVVVTGSRANTELYQALSGRVPERYLVGDCVEPRNIMEATTDGFNIGQTI